MESQDCIYEHDAQIIPHLVSHLPYSSTVLRRIQHGLVYPSATAKILATFPPGATPEQPWLAAQVDLFRGRETQMVVYSSLEAEHTSNEPIGPVNPATSQTDSHYHTNKAADPHHHDQHATTATTTPADDDDHLRVSTLATSPLVLARARAQLLALLSYVKAYLRPIYLSSLQPASAAAGTSPIQNNPQPNHPAVPLIPPPDPLAFLLGSLHTGLFALLQQSGSYPGSYPLAGLRVHRVDFPPYYKYVFPREVFCPEGGESENDTAELDLPPGYRYHDRRGRVGVLPSQLDLVQSRTHIPRSRKQLSSMPGVAVYYDSEPSLEGQFKDVKSEDAPDEMPIAWAFLGTDGALATLHVEPEHRGRGIAFRLSKEVMRREMAPDGIYGSGSAAAQYGLSQNPIGDWVHTEVAQRNQASRRVMDKIGGRPLTTVVWTCIELCD
ncbi:hypothetical protein NUU61_000626 [Penicillium alfredii]|uniref:N-acetyltransferase domain-containing protein n=1 Tax=Penicillium alfredii TaxID=1506179 RepID=A0A9W9GAB1_9EURO|nr:uncharacterized protein NUU61_000626 [Penicillium alfredii]KAJ5114867.1 hypothetical protein NUU61_000626 [Penicillium alfredii]